MYWNKVTVQGHAKKPEKKAELRYSPHPYFSLKVKLMTKNEARKLKFV